jgi:hypothetical protein
MRKILLVSVLGCLVLAPAAQGNVMLHVINHAGIGKSRLHRVELAITRQANRQLRPVWGTPKIGFANYGFKVFLKSGLGPPTPGGRHPTFIGEHRYGHHPYLVGKHRYIVIFTSGAPWTVVLSHEVLEMMVDPRGHRFTNSLRTEVCDAVEHMHYRVRGILVEDFVTPEWFALKHPFAQLQSQKLSDTRPRYDWMRILRRPRQLRGGFMPQLRKSSATLGSGNGVQGRSLTLLFFISE